MNELKLAALLVSALRYAVVYLKSINYKWLLSVDQALCEIFICLDTLTELCLVIARCIGVGRGVGGGGGVPPPNNLRRGGGGQHTLWPLQ